MTTQTTGYQPIMTHEDNVLYLKEGKVFAIDTCQHEEVLRYVNRRVEGSEHAYHEYGYGMEVDFDTETPAVNELNEKEMLTICEEFHERFGQDLAEHDPEYLQDLLTDHPQKIGKLLKQIYA